MTCGGRSWPLVPLGAAVLALSVLGGALSVSAQAPDTCEMDGVRGGETLTVQPTIIVIPFTKLGESMDSVLQEDVNRRVAVTTVKQAFDDRGFATVDLLALIRSLRTGGALRMGAETDFKTQIVQQSRADIYVELEIMEPEEGGDASNAGVIRTAYLTNNGMSLANMIGRSGRYRGVEYSRLVERAAADSIDAFLEVMQMRFDDVVENGAIISFDVSVAEGADYNLNSDVGPDPDVLSFLVEDWFAENAWKNNYSVSSITDYSMVFDAVRIPLYDPQTCRNYNASQFSREFIRFLRDLGLRASQTVSRGSVFIELR
ncbi:MAG: DUF6175 family protein [Longimicrobiales bacterium]|nr:DUF6175 family protein [Longimicrobiales bacterium]